MNLQRITRHLGASLFGLCVLILAVCYSYGASRGFDTRLTSGVEFDAEAIAIALSRIWFHINAGYMGYIDVYDIFRHTLSPNMFVNDNADVKFLHDPTSINAAFEAVKAIPVWSLPTYEFLSQRFMSMRFEDLGMADFYTLAFRIFGANAAAMYNMYYLIMAATLVLFFAEYRKTPVPMLLCTLCIAIFPVFIFSDFFDHVPQMPSVNCNRFMSALGFIPILHAFCIYFMPTNNRLSKSQLGLLALQAIIFAFVVSIRSTTRWQLIGLSAIALVIIAKHLWPDRRRLFLEYPREIYTNWKTYAQNELPLISSIGQYVLAWKYILIRPMLIAALIFFAIPTMYHKTQSLFVNPLYNTDCAMPEHMVWHSIYMGYLENPDWQKVLPYPVASDPAAWIVFENHMKSLGIPQEIACIETGSYRIRLQESVVRDTFIQLTKKHPGFALETFFYYKPLHLFQSMRDILKTVQPRYFIWLGIITLALSAGFAFYLSRQERRRMFHVACTMMLISWIPDIVAYPAYSIDELWIALIAATLGTTMILAPWIERYSKSRQPASIGA